jgi:hypothetical protein
MRIEEINILYLSCKDTLYKGIYYSKTLNRGKPFIYNVRACRGKLFFTTYGE